MAYKYQHRSLQGPKSFVFYVVARVGPNGEYHPLAVASRDDPGERGFAGLDVINACLGVRKLIASKDNRAAIAAEVRLAKAFYSVPRTTQRVYASDVAVPDTISETERAAWSFPISDSSPIAFPATSTCLLAGLGFDLESKTAQDHVELKPLSFTLGPTLDNRGMVIVDVTQPHSVRQGMLAYDFVKQPYNQDDPFFGLTLGDSDDSEVELGFDDETIYPPGPEPVEDWSQMPLDPKGYRAKFDYGWPYGADEKIAMAQAVWKPIDAAALHCKQLLPPLYRIANDVTSHLANQQSFVHWFSSQGSTTSRRPGSRQSDPKDPARGRIQRCRHQCTPS
ncbi:hypothetical protein VHEMI05608 [[Torrubiella] hemipterigena]|uniref:Uncharacterized protein n=1 Tax=[Torrubiella] hemipterigena TaxID=1531966 RepID=A0A0A1THH2_9HYPO|nr:hypothetical protein VHEMI05608 [[Torrubiella] hemipterigena]